MIDVNDLRARGREAERSNPSLFGSVSIPVIYRGVEFQVAATIVDDLECAGIDPGPEIEAILDQELRSEHG